MLKIGVRSQGAVLAFAIRPLMSLRRADSAIRAITSDFESHRLVEHAQVWSRDAASHENVRGIHPNIGKRHALGQTSSGSDACIH
jgi:hypothetical protein